MLNLVRLLYLFILHVYHYKVFYVYHLYNIVFYVWGTSLRADRWSLSQPSLSLPSVLMRLFYVCLLYDTYVCLL